MPYDYRVLLPGYSDELAYDLGLIEANGSFAETQGRGQGELTRPICIATTRTSPRRSGEVA